MLGDGPPDGRAGSGDVVAGGDEVVGVAAGGTGVVGVVGVAAGGDEGAVGSPVGVGVPDGAGGVVAGDGVPAVVVGAVAGGGADEPAPVSAGGAEDRGARPGTPAPVTGETSPSSRPRVRGAGSGGATA